MLGSSQIVWFSDFPAVHLPLAVASGYFDFSLSGFVCQVRLLAVTDARHKGNRIILLVVFVEKSGESWWKIFFAPVCYNEVMAYIRKFKTTSGATGVQVCYKEGDRVVRTVHVGSAASAPAIEKLVKKAQGIIDAEKNPLFNLSKYDKKGN